ncbi:MAG: 50S ribosomal protein L11 methyltransferase [Betaproteobacteria bacterium]|nr:50S ribosomal protein L11 methyltransferase [Betaproteobacteria bacterium]
MAYREVIIPADDDLAESLSDALLEQHALSVGVEDREAGTEDEQALFGEPGMPAPRSAWQHNLVRALFDTEAQADAALLTLLSAGLLRDLSGVHQIDVPEQDWVRLTQSQFTPVCIEDRLWIAPSWHAAPADAPLVIQLDPGLAFGTGTHPTTQLCLSWLVKHAPLDNLTVLDYGCGSGILAIAAARLGAQAATAVDIDPVAVDATLANAQANAVQLQRCCHVDALPAERFDLVLANILAAPLRLLAPMLAERAKPGGWLVLSGILSRQAEELIAVYAPFAHLQIYGEQDGWVCLAGMAYGHE